MAADAKRIQIFAFSADVTFLESAIGRLRLSIAARTVGFGDWLASRYIAADVAGITLPDQIRNTKPIRNKAPNTWRVWVQVVFVR